MQDVIIMELDTNLSFKASIDNPPEVKHSFTTVYVDEKEVKELLARMEMVYLDKGETIASATLPEQSLYIIVSGILHTYTTHEGEERTNRFFSAGDAVLCYNSSQYSIKTLTKCAAYYISEEEIEELCATSISFANLVRQLMEYQFYFKEEENMNVRKLTVRERYLSLLAEIPDILYRVPLKYITHYLGADVTSLGYMAGSSK